MDPQILRNSENNTISSQSQHRLPTVSAAQALQDLQHGKGRCISTGLPRLDVALSGVSTVSRDASDGATTTSAGGVERGVVTEIWGPPGAGKTALGLQCAVNALHNGDNVVWIDAAHPLPGPRLQQLLSSPFQSNPSNDVSKTRPPTTQLLSKLTHFSTPSLPHLLALILNPTPAFLPPNTTLLIIDSLSSLLTSTFLIPVAPPTKPVDTPKNLGPGPNPKTPAPDKWAQNRRFGVIQTIISALQKLASVYSVAVVVLSQSVSRAANNDRSRIYPAISTPPWQTGVATRVVCWREGGRGGVGCARVVRRSGANFADGEKVGFRVSKSSIIRAEIPSEESELADLGAGRKRRAQDFGHVEEDDARDGSDEDYGWEEEDEEMLPPPPPQYQGSEDILVPGLKNDEEDDEIEDENEDEDEEKEQGELEQEEQEYSVHLNDTEELERKERPPVGQAGAARRGVLNDQREIPNTFLDEDEEDEEEGEEEWVLHRTSGRMERLIEKHGVLAMAEALDNHDVGDEDYSAI